MKCIAILSVVVSIAGCSVLSTSNEPAIPSSKGERSPINTIATLDFSMGKFSTGVPESRIRRLAPGAPETGAATQAVDLPRFPLTTRYVHGTSTPIVVCAVMHVCDIELQAGEKIIPPIRTGDKARWGIDVLMSGQSPSEVAHLTLMPLEGGIETSLMVLTNRRSYHLFLRSSRTDSMLRTVFLYPDDMAAKWTASETPAVSVK